MAIDFACTCGKVLRAPDEFAGKKAKCSGCGQAVDVPGGAKASNGAASPAASPKAAPSPPRKPAAAPPAKAAVASPKPQPAPAKRLAAAEKPKPTPKPAPEVETEDYGLAPAAAMAPASLGDFFDAELSTGPAAIPTGNYCPACRHPVPVNAVVCINCGYDSRTGKKHETVTISNEPAALTPASSGRSKSSGGALSTEKGMLNSGVLGGLGLMVAGAAWFFLGLAADRIYPYPVVMFFIGIGAIAKGLFARGDG